jgi:citrate lyase subunit beta / citryl-CoA lyase
MRSLLFVPGDSARKLEKAAASGADLLLLDLEDSVAPSAKATARDTVRGFLRTLSGASVRPLLYVRVNALDGGDIDADLDAVMPCGPDGIMLPKALSGIDVQHLAAKLAVREAENGLPDGGTRIIPVATELARALFTLGTYRGASHRLAGLTWGAEDLAADIGAETNRLADGTYTDPFRLARSLALFAAHGAGVEAVDTVYPDFRNEAGFLAEAEAARRDGFTAKMAIHPAQVPVINAVFSPTPEAVARARRIVDAFAAAPGVGVIAMDGQMVDRPHLRLAERVLARAGSRA